MALTESRRSLYTPSPSPPRSSLSWRSPVPDLFGDEAKPLKGAFSIWVFRNGDRWTAANRAIFNPLHCKNFEEFLKVVTDKAGLLVGAVHRLYTMAGVPVTALEQLVPNMNYVATGLEPFQRIAYNLSDGAFADAQGPAEPAPSRRSMGSRRSLGGGESVKKFGIERRKMKTIFVFRNDDAKNDAERIAVVPKRYTSFDKLLMTINSVIPQPDGVARQLFTTDGWEVKSLEELEDGGYYVAVGGLIRFKKVAYRVPPDAPNAAPAEEKPEPEWGARTANLRLDGKVFVVFKNGDKFHRGESICCASRFYRHFDRLLDYLSKRLGIITGVRKLVALDGVEITSLDQLETNACYVACGAEPFVAMDYQLPQAPAEIEEEDDFVPYIAKHRMVPSPAPVEWSRIPTFRAPAPVR